MSLKSFSQLHIQLCLVCLLCSIWMHW